MFWLMVIGVVALSLVTKSAKNKEYAAVVGDGAEFANLSIFGMSNMELAQEQQFMDDMNCLQDMQKQQFMDDMNMLQQMQDQRFMDDMNMLQDRQFMDDMNTFSMNSVTPFEMGGMDMEKGNSFNLFDNLCNDFGSGFGGCDFGCGGMF